VSILYHFHANYDLPNSTWDQSLLNYPLQAMPVYSWHFTPGMREGTHLKGCLFIHMELRIIQIQIKDNIRISIEKPLFCSFLPITRYLQLNLTSLLTSIQKQHSWAGLNNVILYRFELTIFICTHGFLMLFQHSMTFTTKLNLFEACYDITLNSICSTIPCARRKGISHNFLVTFPRI